MTAGRERQTAVSDLRLSVYLRALHPEFFQIHASRDFQGLAFGGQIWLIEGGHVVVFVDGPDAVSEVVAPKGLELPKRGLARTADLAGAREHHLEARGTLLYQMAYQVDVCAAGRYVREAEDLLASARSGHVYAEEPRKGPGRAFSYAVPEPKGRGLIVHVWHGFPAEHTILRTQTLIERV